MTKSPIRFGHGRPATVPRDDSNKRYVFVKKARCPECQSPDLKVYGAPRGAIASTDGTQSRYVRCRPCGCRFILVAE
jgi:DNA-directed RNA polymerase subunit RPC12/RpoP